MVPAKSSRGPWRRLRLLQATSWPSTCCYRMHNMSISRDRLFPEFFPQKFPVRPEHVSHVLPASPINMLSLGGRDPGSANGATQMMPVSVSAAREEPA